MSIIHFNPISAYASSIYRKRLLLPATSLCFTSFLIFGCSLSAHAGGTAPAYEIDMKELDRLKSVPKHVQKKQAPPTPKPVEKRTLHGTTDYTVKPGDFLFRILIREFGLSNREAELLIPEVMRANNLTDGTRLTVGSKLVIPKEKKLHTDERQAARPQGKHSSRKQTPEQQSHPAEPTKKEITAITPEAVPAVIEKSEPVVIRTEPLTPALPAILKVQSISGSEYGQNLDLILSALSISCSRDRVIEERAGQGSPESFSIKVERYVEFDGRRYVLTGSRKNPYEYTFLRLLEMAGYKVLMFEEQPGLAAVATKLLTQFGLAYSAGKHRFTVSKDGESRVYDGFLVSLKTPGSRVFITGTPLDAVITELLGSSSVEHIKQD